VIGLAGYWREAPLTPDADEARRLLGEELAKPDYSTGRSLLSRLLEWLQRLLVPDFGGHGPPWGVLLVALGAIAIIVAVSLIVAGPLRPGGRVKAPARGVLEGETRTADALRDAAAHLARRGEWREAALTSFRAAARSLEERGILADSPGRTADEIAADAGDRLPALAARLGEAGDLFDRLAYGGRRADAGHYELMEALDSDLARTRPAAPAAVAP
jgi:hypothetical protein